MQDWIDFFCIYLLDILILLQAIERAIRETFKAAQMNSSKESIVHFKVSPQGITLTDNARKYV